MNSFKAQAILSALVLATLLLAGCTESLSNGTGKALGLVSPDSIAPVAGPETRHLRCQNQQCVLIMTELPNQCTSNRDCILQPVHNECRNQQCTPITGPGPNRCQTNADCVPSTNPHNECQNQQCVMVETGGHSQCRANADCAIAAPDFNIQSINEAHMSGSGVGAIAFTVKNTGTANYQGTLKHQGIIYKIDTTPAEVISTTTWDASSDNYAIGSSFTYTQPAELPNGYYKFRAIADSNGNVSEPDESNNQMEYYFTIDDANAELCNQALNENQSVDRYLDSSGNTAEFTPILALPTQENCYYYSRGGPVALLFPQQSVGIHASARMDITNMSIKDLAARIYPNDYNYFIQFRDGIPNNLDFRHGDYAVIPFLGERYKIIDMTKINGFVNKIKLQNMNNYNDTFWIVNGREFPYNENGNGSNSRWIVGFIPNGNNLTGITIKNSAQYWGPNNPLYSPSSFYGQAQPAIFLKNSGSPKNGFAKAWFDGFKNFENERALLEFKKGANVAIGTGGTTFGAIHYFDGSTEHYIPMAIYLAGTTPNGSTIPFDGVNQVYWTDSPVNISRLAIDNNSGALPIGPNPDYNVPVAKTDTDYNYSHVVQLQGKNNKKYRYFARRSATNPSTVWLVLAGYSDYSSGESRYTGYIDDVTDSQQNSVGGLFLLGTITNDAAAVFPIQRTQFNSNNPNSFFRPIYYPDVYDYNGTQQGSVTKEYRMAVFRLRENLGNGYPNPSMPDDNETNSFEIFIDTEGGNSGTIDTNAIFSGTKPYWNGPTTALVYFNQNPLQRFSEYLSLPGESSPNYKKAYTNNGSKVELENRELAIRLPSEKLPVSLRLVVEPPPQVSQWPPLQHAEK